MSHVPRYPIFTVSSAQPFIDTVAEFLLAETTFPFEDWTVYLPTRFACISLEQSLKKQVQKEALLLPKIIPLGDVDTAELVLKGGGEKALSVPSPLRYPRRLVLLAELLSKFRYQSVSLSFYQRLSLAENVMKIIDALRREGVPLSTLKNFSVENNRSAEHWAHIHLFLSVIADYWDAILQEEDALDPAQWHRHMMDIHQESLKNATTPVMVAGSLGTVSSTVDLIKRVAHLDHGVVVLPGLLKGLDDQTLSPKHPQYFLYRLLSTLEISSGEVQTLSPRKAVTAQNFSTLFERSDIKNGDSGVCHIDYLAAPDQRAEGEMIALAIREALARGKKKVACLSPDLKLLSYVSAALKVWDIEVPSPNSMCLIHTDMGRFLHALSSLFLEDVTLDHLRLIFHHPFASARREMWQTLEKNIFRRVTGVFSIKHLEHVFASQKDKFSNKEDLELFFSELKTLLSFSSRKLTFSHVLQYLEKWAQWVTGQDMSMDALFSFYGAENFIPLWADLKKTQATLTVEEGDVGAILMALFQEKQQASYAFKNGIHLCTPIEGRFIHADMIILSGLNEGVWPEEVGVDPFLTRSMQKELNLLPIEHTYGQSAHDFISHLSAKEVLLTYATNVKGAPALPSEFLSYLRSFMLRHDLPLTERKDILAYWEKMRACPKKSSIKAPAVQASSQQLPKRFSVSDVMALQKDPYRFYAKHVLNLRPLEGYVAQDTHRHFGIFVHALLERAVLAEETKKTFLKDLFERYFGCPEKNLFLWHKSQFILEWFEKQPRPSQVAVEKWGQYTFPLQGKNVTLFAKADRIDVTGIEATIIDYKTGQVPSQSAIKRGEAPQLSLEGLILTKGEFEGVSKDVSLSALAHWKVPMGDENGELSFVRHSLETLLVETEEGLRNLLSYFQKSTALYLSYPHGWTGQSDYDHLARVAEWYTESERT